MSTAVNEQEVIQIDIAKSTPIYRQIVESIHQAIVEGLLQEGDSIPSVNATAARFSIARGSVFKAYNELRSAGIIDSFPGKGYFVISTRQSKKKNIFLLMSTYNPYREVFYNAFIDKLKNQATVDTYFHHHNIQVFETLIQNHASHYNTFVIMPEIHKDTCDILTKLDQRQLFILDTGLTEYGKNSAGVCQNYRRDIYAFLESIIERMTSYKRTLLLFSSNMRTYDVIKGFKSFFRRHPQFESKVIRKTASFVPNAGDLCLVMDDNDLVNLILHSKQQGWALGEDLGIISYNETPLKSVVGDGISTITPDYEQMGTSMAELVLANKRELVENPFLMLDRQSF